MQVHVIGRGGGWGVGKYHLGGMNPSYSLPEGHCSSLKTGFQLTP